MKREVEDLEMPRLGKRGKYPGLTEDETRRLEAWIREGAERPERGLLEALDQ